MLSLVRPFFYFSVYSPFFVHFLEYLFFLQTSPIHPSLFSLLFLSGRLFYFIFFFNTTSFSISHFLDYWPYGSGGSLGLVISVERAHALNPAPSTLLLSLFPRLGPIVRDSNRAAFIGFWEFFYNSFSTRKKKKLRRKYRTTHFYLLLHVAKRPVMP